MNRVFGLSGPSPPASSLIAAFWRDESGTTLIEYALVAGLVTLAIVTGASLLGTNLAAKYQAIVDAYK